MEINEMNLHQKMLKIAHMAGALQRTKSGFGYKYVPEEDIQAKITAGMQKYGVMLYTGIAPGTLKVVPYTYQKFDKKVGKEVTCNEVIVYADTTYTWVNVDNPEEKIESTWGCVGQMEDAAQAFGAAETYANRYYLMKALQLATTESDPDGYRSKQKSAEKFEDEEVEREARERLEESVQKVVDKGTELIKAGVKKEAIVTVVKKYNNGDGNPSSLSTVEACEQVLADFEKLH